MNTVSQWSTQIVVAARSTQPSQIIALGIVPKNADLENRNFGRVSGPFDLALTKVNAAAKTLGQKQKCVAAEIFPRVERRASKVIEPIR